MKTDLAPGLKTDLYLVHRDVRGKPFEIELVDGQNRVDYCDCCTQVWPIKEIVYVPEFQQYLCPFCG